jgi:hypothetical protein
MDTNGRKAALQEMQHHQGLFEHQSEAPRTVANGSMAVTLSASSHASHALRQAGRRAEWQVSWDFRGRPVDCRDAETAKNRSPEANSLRTS